MSERHIRRLIVIGAIVEAISVLAAIYGALWFLCWIAEQLPEWAIPLEVAIIPIIGIFGIIWDTKHSIEFGGNK